MPLMNNLRRTMGFLPCCFLLVLASGCAITQDYRRPDVTVPDGWRLDYETAADTANTAWWEQFRDPVLNDLIRSALNENRDIRVAAARVDEYKARLQIVKGGYYPQIGYGLSAVRDMQSLERAIPLPADVDRTNDTYSFNGGVAWELDLWGKLRRSSEAAGADLLSAEEARRGVILTLVSDIAESYITLLAMDKLLLVSRETLASREEFMKLFERKFAGGQISAMELAQVRSSFLQAAEVVPELERKISLQENALSVLLGRNPGPIKRGKTLDSLAAPDVPQDIPSEILTRRPDIRQCEQNLIAANARVGVAKTLYFPAISLTGLFGYASTSLSDLFLYSANEWQTGAGAAGSIFTGGRIKGQIRQAEAQQQELLNEYLRTIQSAFKEVEDSLISIQKYRELSALQSRHVAVLKEYASLAHKRYDAKYTSYIEVLDAERSLFTTETAHIRTQNDLIAALINNFKALGGGWVAKADELIDPPARTTDVEGHKQ